MNNEPVAIVNTNCENNIQWYDNNPEKHNGYFLYTHPVKELTEKEIVEVINEHGWRGLTGYLLTFAHAILRKAQEK